MKIGDLVLDYGFYVKGQDFFSEPRICIVIESPETMNSGKEKYACVLRGEELDIVPIGLLQTVSVKSSK